MRTRRWFLILALTVAGCAGPEPSGWPFLLITGNAPDKDGRCFGYELAKFVLDRTYGVALEWGDGTGPVPAAWPRGFTARWVGSQIQVFDQQGKFAVETGKTYGYWSAGTVEPDEWVGTQLPPAGAYYVCRGFDPSADG